MVAATSPGRPCWWTGAPRLGGWAIAPRRSPERLPPWGFPHRDHARRLPSGTGHHGRREGGTMYGTVAKMQVQPGKAADLKAEMDRQMVDAIAGYVKSYVLMENDTDTTVWLTVVFEDKDSYMKNADDPAQHERFMAMRAFLAADPEWHDGMIEEG